MQILDGRLLAKKIRSQIAEDVAALPFRPGLAVILVGDDPASHLYVSLKERAAAEAGIYVEVNRYGAETPQKKIIDDILAFNLRPDIQAILVQVPLPARFDENQVTQSVVPEKDVDGFHPESVRRLQTDESNAIVPPVALGIIALIKEAVTEGAGDLAGKKALVIANSQIFADVLGIVLGRAGLQAYKNVGDAISLLSLEADVIVIARGRVGTLSSKDIKDGAIVIDVGTNKIDGRTVGDVDVNGLSMRNIYLSPVPGGVGPMTIAMLLRNTLELAKNYRGQF
ncbi:MAG: folD [Candidatus Magasanikbacteria bacterium]|nr:folD [Candidatus Magasanikbacteria bacterium]